MLKDVDLIIGDTVRKMLKDVDFDLIYLFVDF